MRALLFLMHFIAGVVSCFGQFNAGAIDTLNTQQFIKGCATYREFAISGMENALHEFVTISNALASTSKVPEAHNQFRDIIVKAALTASHGAKSENISALLRKMVSNDNLSGQVYVSWLEKHFYEIQELSLLIQSEFLEAERPYRMAAPRVLWEEVSFYGIDSGMSIADIGAGNGFLGFVLAGTEVPGKITMTELNPDMLIYLNERLDRGEAFFKTTNLSVVEADIKTTNLGVELYDVIIMREVFHHLSHPEAILQDCKKHLRPGGSLFLKEGTKDLPDEKHDHCKQALRYSQIVKLVKNAGYRILKQKVIDYSWMIQITPE